MLHLLGFNGVLIIPGGVISPLSARFAQFAKNGEDLFLGDLPGF